MKEGIHPKYEQTTIRCACGEVIETGSTKKDIKVEICSKCHPFYTGKMKIVDSAGRAGADLIVTPCPLCQMQLDMYEPEGRDAVQSSVEIPILHLQQLIGLALGMSKKDVGFDRHVSAQEKLRIG